IQPNCSRPFTNAAFRSWVSASVSMAPPASTPIRRMRSPCCACAGSGHAATPPSSVTNARRLIIRSPRRRGRAGAGAHLALSFERQPEDELTIHRHDGVEVETDMVIDRGHIALSALQWMAMLQAATAGGIENQVYRRLSLIRDK